jgi:hypothetical protein
MLDEAALQRGIEDYMERTPRKYPYRFHTVPHLNEFATNKLRQEAIAKGENPDDVAPVVEDIDYIEVTQSPDNIPDHPVSAKDLEIYGEEYRRWKQGKESAKGTLLDEWARLDKHMKLRLQMWNVFTIEQFLEMDPVSRNSIGPGMDRFVEEARRFLGLSIIKSRKDEEQKKEQRIAELEAKLEKLTALAQKAEQPQQQEKRR